MLIVLLLGVYITHRGRLKCDFCSRSVDELHFLLWFGTIVAILSICGLFCCNCGAIYVPSAEFTTNFPTGTMKRILLCHNEKPAPPEESKQGVSFKVERNCGTCWTLSPKAGSYTAMRKGENEPFEHMG